MGSPLSRCASSPQGDGILAAGRPLLDASDFARASFVRRAQEQNSAVDGLRSTRLLCGAVER
jgi:hypothetical protein